MSSQHARPREFEAGARTRTRGARPAVRGHAGSRPRTRLSLPAPLQGRPRALRPLTALLAPLALTALLAACGGGDGGAPTGPKSCQQDPSQSFCQDTTTKPSPTLASAAQAKGRYFGTAVDALFTATTQTPAYMATLGKEFSMITPGNVLKWEPLRRNGRFAAYRYAWPDSMLAYATSHGMKLRGHTLAWHNQNPAWLTDPSVVAQNADTMRAVLMDHITNVVGHYKGKIYAWDVVNEALNDGDGTLRVNGNPWALTIGRSYIETAFRTARSADPNALLFYNDYSLEYPGAKQDSAYALLADFRARGVPVDGIGFQGHIQINADGSGNPGKQSLVATFNRFAALGLKIEITELDVRVQTTAGNPTAAALTAQSQAYGDIVSACLAVPACDAIVVWGVTDAESWIPSTFSGWGQALLFDGSYGKKATYNAVMSALTGS